MKENNPFIIPRNHIIENVIEKAVDGDLKQLKKFLKYIQNHIILKMD